MKTVCIVLGAFVFFWAATGQAGGFRFPEVAGWKQAGEIQTFDPRTLFEYIDGAADLYLAYDFQELQSAEYRAENKASVTVDVYRHATPDHAFGIYSQERLAGGEFLDIGVQGYLDKNLLNFVTGNYYVKIASFGTGPEDREVLLAFGRKTETNLGQKGALPSLLSGFPPEGKILRSEKFVARNFLGYPFLRSAFTADYEVSGQAFRLFILRGADQEDCRGMLQKHLEETGSAGKKAFPGSYSISDPHHGPVALSWKGRHLWGILNTKDTALAAKYLALLEKALPKEP